MSESEKFEQWAIIEVMGHNRISGKITEQTLGGTAFIRVDVPAVDGRQSFTKLLGSSAIYAVNFVDEETATAAAKSVSAEPVDEWSARRMLESKSPEIPHEETD